MFMKALLLFHRMMGSREREDGVMKTMILFSLAMLFFPVFLYFFSKRMLFEGKFLFELINGK